MSIFKCKMCGGALELNGGETVATCEYCGTQQTLPKLDDDRKVNLYDRANHFRRNNEFDKAMGIYEQILNEDTTDAEAYWSLVLCCYGIEYVEDPSSHKRIPTVNRAQFTSIFDNDNYKSALQYADGYQRIVYEEEAKTINEIQKGILAISQMEEPFDVFICYKETDNNGCRTPDSVLANDLYHQLTLEGFKVFFSRITLEDKIGSAYEPYIFAALNSAKVMVVLGTKPEFFKAVWVRNEWSRYLALIKQGQKKTLIPAYKDMDPYDLPEEFSHLQAQDMSKLGFMQDLIRGIKKIAQTEAPKQTVIKETVITAGNVSTAPLIKRVFLFLEDGAWNSANEYCEKVLDIDPENAEAYLGKLMAEMQIKKQEDLKDCAEPFDNNSNCQKAIRFADETLKSALVGYIEHINTRNENARLDGIYHQAKDAMSAASTEGAYKETARLFETISGYMDASILAQKCYERAEAVRKDAILADGKSKMTGDVVSDYEAAIKLFESISGWKDADENVYACQRKIEALNAKAEADRFELERKTEMARKNAARIAKRNKKIALIAAPIVCVVAAVIIIWAVTRCNNHTYDSWTIEKDATCTETGIKTAVCSNCGAETQETIAIKAHAYGSWTIGKNADCTEAGDQTRTCADCGAEDHAVIEAKGHAYGSWTIGKDADCTEAGEQSRICSDCGAEEHAVIEAKGHSYDGGTVTMAATCTTEGEKKYICRICGAEKTDRIDVLGHDFDDNLVCTRCSTQGSLESIMTPDEKAKAARVHERTDSYFYFDNQTKQLIFEFAFRDDLGNYLKVPTWFEISIVNDDGKEVYAATKLVRSSDYIGTSAVVRIDEAEVKGGSTKTGSVTVRFYNANYFSFEGGSDSLPFDLPIAPITIALPTLPAVFHDFDYKGNIDSSVKITDITYEKQEYTSMVKFYVSGEKTYDTGDSNYTIIRWKLYDEDGYVFDDGTISLSKINAGEKFRDYFYVYDIVPGEIYTFKLFDGD